MKVEEDKKFRIISRVLNFNISRLKTVSRKMKSSKIIKMIDASIFPQIKTQAGQ